MKWNDEENVLVVERNQEFESKNAAGFFNFFFFSFQRRWDLMTHTIITIHSHFAQKTLFEHICLCTFSIITFFLCLFYFSSFFILREQKKKTNGEIESKKLIKIKGENESAKKSTIVLSFLGLFYIYYVLSLWFLFFFFFCSVPFEGKSFVVFHFFFLIEKENLIEENGKSEETKKKEENRKRNGKKRSNIFLIENCEVLMQLKSWQFT